jgi:hypothetical protein
MRATSVQDKSSEQLFEVCRRLLLLQLNSTIQNVARTRFGSSPRRPLAVLSKPNNLRHHLWMRLRRHSSLLLVTSSAVSRSNPATGDCLVTFSNSVLGSAIDNTLFDVGADKFMATFGGDILIQFSKAFGPSPLKWANWTWPTLSRLRLVERRVSSAR